MSCGFVRHAGILASYIATNIRLWFRPSGFVEVMPKSPTTPPVLPPPLPEKTSQPSEAPMAQPRFVGAPLEAFLNEMLRMTGDVPVSITFPDAVFDMLVVDFNCHARLAVDPSVGFVELVLNVGPRKCQLLRATNPDRALAGMRCARCHALYKRPEHECVEHVEILGLCVSCRNKGVKQ